MDEIDTTLTFLLVGRSLWITRSTGPSELRSSWWRIVEVHHGGMMICYEKLREGEAGPFRYAWFEMEPTLRDAIDDHWERERNTNTWVMSGGERISVETRMTNTAAAAIPVLTGWNER